MPFNLLIDILEFFVNRSIDESEENLALIDEIRNIILEGIDLDYWTVIIGRKFLTRRPKLFKSKAEQKAFVKRQFKDIRKYVLGGKPNDQGLARDLIKNFIKRDILYNKNKKAELKAFYKQLTKKSYRHFFKAQLSAMKEGMLSKPKK